MRRIIRHSLEYVAQGGWDDEEIGIYSQMLSDNIMNANPSSAMLQIPLGLQLHVANLFPEELAKVLNLRFSSDALPCSIANSFRPEERILLPQLF